SGGGVLSRDSFVHAAEAVMSLDSLERFNQLVGRNATVRKELESATGRADAIECAVRLGAAHGLVFTAAEIEAQLGGPKVARGRSGAARPGRGLLPRVPLLVPLPGRRERAGRTLRGSGRRVPGAPRDPDGRGGDGPAAGLRSEMRLARGEHRALASFPRRGAD